MRDEWSAILLSAAASSVLFISTSVLKLDSLFLFTSSIPLFMLGLHKSAKAMLYASGLAACAIASLGNINALLFFVGYLCIPALLMAPRALLPSPDPAQRWYPIGLILVDLAFYSALTVAGIELHLYSEGGIQGVLQEQFKASTQVLDPELQSRWIEFLSTNSFLLVGAGMWWWIFLLYIHMLIANHLLKLKKIRIRESLALESFMLPGWTLPLLVGFALGSFAEGTAGFIARTCLIIFLLPYYLAGVNFLRNRMRDWPNKGLWMFMIYLFSLLYVVPIFMVAAIGVWRQCKGFGRPAAE